MTFTYNGSKISATELTIGGEEDAYALALVLAGADEKVLVKHLRFAQYQYAASVEGDEPVPRVTAESSDTDIRTAYAAWRKLPGSFSDVWVAELGKVEKAAKNE